jgi:hypothetical protein
LSPSPKSYIKDPVNEFQFLSEAYRATDFAYSGRVTVPVLWDKQSRTIVNNSEDDICHMFNDAFRRLGDASIDLFPASIAADQDRLSTSVYEQINNGVFQARVTCSQRPKPPGTSGSGMVFTSVTASCPGRLPAGSEHTTASARMGTVFIWRVAAVTWS